MTEQTLETSDFIIVGSGVAGLWTALALAPHGSVRVVTKEGLTESNTLYAQGGIAAAYSPEDRPQLHLEDTITAGAGLCDYEAVQALTYEGPHQIDELIRLGAHFDTLNGHLDLTKEAAHRARRILHADGDATGKEVHRALSDRALHTPRLAISEHTFLVDLELFADRCVGVHTFNTRTGHCQVFRARAILLASGGLGQLFEVTTNPPVTTGDGIAVAYRNGAEVCDLEFVQFHPTALHDPSFPKFLVSEAVRGEGAQLLNSQGQRFMPRYHPDAELAPRDVVARAIVSELKRTGDRCVFLDFRTIEPEVRHRRFPHIGERVAELGLSLDRDPIPVSPAAHYAMGGILVDLHGRTAVPGLYACGECACFGLHGANRLASNSMLEGLVFGARSAAAMQTEPALPQLPPPEKKGRAACPHQQAAHLRARLRHLMWEEVGIVRTAEGLRRAREELRQMRAQLGDAAACEGKQCMELRNMLTVAELMALAAELREESRGAHYRADFPEPNDAQWHKHIVLRRSPEGDPSVRFWEVSSQHGAAVGNA